MGQLAKCERRAGKKSGWQVERMDLYSILGQELSVDDSLPHGTDSAAGLPLVAEPVSRRSLAGLPNAGLPGHVVQQNLVQREVVQEEEDQSQENAAALRELAEARLNAILDATVERVRYITNASGVALALCENEEDAMVCRASGGPAAPEVGARMYIRSGITGESMKTRQTLRCDRASSDPRVNQESCKALGIESVMVMPLILGRNVVGMFELFGAKPAAFAERDAMTLRAAVPLLESGLREAVNTGMPLGRIPWAEEAPASAAVADEALPEETLSDGTLSDETDATDETLTFKLPMAFPIDAFRRTEAQETAATDPAQSDDQEVPAFLARLADEARPASHRTWSQWFRPQW